MSIGINALLLLFLYLLMVESGYANMLLGRYDLFSLIDSIMLINFVVFNGYSKL